ncbi:hypothetical protein CXG81DRAFT_30177 [Caulochytrium protostelioides]|uniref:UDP-glucuronate decarboxylase n=1 Tax=Caulochytrium protostelioides TaxID=1555241 RepID=A0A4P9X3D1_9FUNG|nr:hypothetical protein CXG81DRAFT_30177 [Caulochytrium protostelioides]|eukprot:RKO99514.1 hypothetical protein CXG81DRAFT_30177 [Caulochytrium protostelioides]
MRIRLRRSGHRDETEQRWPRGARELPVVKASAEARPASSQGGGERWRDTVGTAAGQTPIRLERLQALYLTGNPGFIDDSPSGTIVYDQRAVRYPAVAKLPPSEKKRILVTGGAGFVGSHLVDRLMLMGHEVIALDNFFTGHKSNLTQWFGHPNFDLVRHDVVDPYMCEIDQIYHLACPASPFHYQYNPVKTVKTSVMGTLNMLGLAKRTRARFLLASTSEIYGSPEVHPQNESYWGHVNPIGPRACYDEGKRVAETLTSAYKEQSQVDVRIARIFNTFGPRMSVEDGRVVSNFIAQALKGEPLTIYGSGEQTRSFQYIHDLVDGLIALMASDDTSPVNLGNPDEFTILQLAEMIRAEVRPDAPLVFHPSPVDDPQRRKPDITKAKAAFGWAPRFSVQQGIVETVKYFCKLFERVPYT